MVYIFRFFNHRRLTIVANTYEEAMSVLTSDQKRDIKFFTARSCTIVPSHGIASF